MHVIPVEDRDKLIKAINKYIILLCRVLTPQSLLSVTSFVGMYMRQKQEASVSEWLIMI